MSTTHLTDRKVSVEKAGKISSLLPHPPERPHPETKTSTSEPLLLSRNEVESWRQDNPYILRGYRPLSRSMAKSVLSWTYLHNETMNIYSHLVPAICVLMTAPFTYRVFISSYPLAVADDLALLAFFLFSVVVCFSFSAGFHTLQNHSKHVCNLSLRCDYVGIIILILGEFVSGVRMGFFCEPRLRMVYWTMVRTSTICACND
jgi:adiponectin receptor